MMEVENLDHGQVKAVNSRAQVFRPLACQVCWALKQYIIYLIYIMPRLTCDCISWASRNPISKISAMVSCLSDMTGKNTRSPYRWAACSDELPAHHASQDDAACSEQCKPARLTNTCEGCVQSFANCRQLLPIMILTFGIIEGTCGPGQNTRTVTVLAPCLPNFLFPDRSHQIKSPRIHPSDHIVSSVKPGRTLTKTGSQGLCMDPAGWHHPRTGRMLKLTQVLFKFCSNWLMQFAQNANSSFPNEFCGYSCSSNLKLNVALTFCDANFLKNMGHHISSLENLLQRAALGADRLSWLFTLINFWMASRVNGPGSGL